MNKRILQQEIQEYINNHLKSDFHKLILKGIPFEGITVQEVANQLICKQKSEKKLPTWFLGTQIYYPSRINIEQTSSELTAKYKTALVSGKKLIDLTGGFGVDSYYFSTAFEKVIHCELDENLSRIVSHNFKQLNKTNIDTVSENSIQYLKKSKEFYDVIYVDPSRRDDVKGKVFLLKDCKPNIPKYIDLLFNKTKTILIKCSPILDITSALNELKFVKEIHVVAVNNDVKELLYLMEKEYNGNVKINTINFSKKNSQEFNFDLNKKSISNFEEPLNYLYEPNAAILKSGGFHEVTNQLDVYKIHQHSHLYTSKNLVKFPGRKFKIVNVLGYDKKKILKILPNKKANITTRNFSKSVAQLRKELKIKDGGNDYLFFTTNLHHKLICIHCERL